MEDKEEDIEKINIQEENDYLNYKFDYLKNEVESYLESKKEADRQFIKYLRDIISEPWLKN